MTPRQPPQPHEPAERTTTPLQRIAFLVAPIALIIVAAAGSSSRHRSFDGLVLGGCIALAVASGVVLALVGGRSGYVRSVPARSANPADLADLAVLNDLEPGRADRPKGQR